MTRVLRPAAVAVGALILLLLAASLTLGADTFLGGKIRTGQSITISAGETVSSDLYLFAGTVVMNGTVDGDLVATAGTIEIDGNVTGNVLAAGGTISVGGTVDGDVRAIGGTVTISGPVGKDAALGGGSATVSAAGSVGGDLLIAGGTVNVSGPVAGDIEARAGTYERSGSLGGTENVVISPQRVTADSTRNAIFDAVRQFVALILFGALAIWLLPGALRAADGELRRRPLVALGGGLATVAGYIVFVIAVVLLMIVIGIGFGLLRLGAIVGIELVAGMLAVAVGTFGFVFGVVFAGDLVIGLSLGRLVMPSGVTSRWQELGLLVGGAALVVIATSLPYVGGWLKLVVVLFGLGALAVAGFEAWRSRWRGGRTAPPAATPMPPAPTPEATA